jgi:hypothetical protein
VKPDSLRPAVWFENDRVTIEKILLNSKDSITLKILLANFDGVIDADARVEGAELKQARFIRRGSNLYKGVVILFYVEISAVALISFATPVRFLAKPVPKYPLLELVVIASLVTLISTFIALAFFIDTERRPNDYAKKKKG